MLIEHCTVCPRQCGARRDETENVGGFCRMPAAPRLARAALHFGEEPCISGTRGSGTVFFSGCVLSCAFCQNARISRGGVGKTVTPARLADIFRELEAAGAHNINLVSPTPFVPAIIEALSRHKPHIPIVYNCGGYERVETLKSLEGLVDIYLPDLKYTDRALSLSLSGVEDCGKRGARSLMQTASCNAARSSAILSFRDRRAHPWRFLISSKPIRTRRLSASCFNIPP